MTDEQAHKLRIETDLAKSQKRIEELEAQIKSMPIQLVKTIVEDAMNQEGDVLADDTWNPDCIIRVGLMVKEIRELAK